MTVNISKVIMSASTGYEEYIKLKINYCKNKNYKR